MILWFDLPDYAEYFDAHIVLRLSLAPGYYGAYFPDRSFTDLAECFERLSSKEKNVRQTWISLLLRVPKFGASLLPTSKMVKKLSLIRRTNVGSNATTERLVPELVPVFVELERN